MVTLNRLYSMEVSEGIHNICVIGQRLIGLVGPEKKRLLVWELAGEMSSLNATLTESLALQKQVASLLPLDFTNGKYFCAGFVSGELFVFDSSSMDIAEEV